MIWTVFGVIIPLYVIAALGEGVIWLYNWFMHKYYPNLNYRRNM